MAGGSFEGDLFSIIDRERSFQPERERERMAVMVALEPSSNGSRVDFAVEDNTASSLRLSLSSSSSSSSVRSNCPKEMMKESGLSHHQSLQKRANYPSTMLGCSGKEQLSAIALVLAALRRSSCKPQVEMKMEMDMEISWPSNVRHVAHVTFDRFKGFLGLPPEFQLEIPRRVPSASTSVFGVSPESMKCSYDKRGNSVPTIILLMQERLYDQGGLKAEGIFRITAGNSQEEYVREQLNKGIVPHDIEVHCLAGLIKAWFRELPRGVLDLLSPERLMQCHTDAQCLEIVKLLPSTQAALLDWAVNLMADVVEDQELNKMNARNIAMVFAPNMSQMSEPLTALRHAVQVMNLLQALILNTLTERKQTLHPLRFHQELTHKEATPISLCGGPITTIGGRYIDEPSSTSFLNFYTHKRLTSSPA